ncbi:helix-turn-helix domain-containing protein [Aeoliella sp.]|uniref:helix-turn-helix domain-containing protein n=1 Tax=Aeoliella sp. TaxID=2795800 RepID=UPI003CCBF2BC
MRFGEQVRALRQERQLTQRELANRLGVSASYISKVENENLPFGDFPSESFIHRLAEELEADEEVLLLLANKIPPLIRRRVLEQPNEFRKLAELDRNTLNRLVSRVMAEQAKQL